MKEMISDFAIGFSGLLMLVLMVFLCGCIEPGQQPSRSQWQRNDFRHCTFNIKGDRGEGEAPANELFTQTQASEGAETVSPTLTPSMTIDTDAALDIPVNKANTGTSSASGALSKLIGAGADWLSGKTAKAAGTGNNTAGGECTGPDCTPSATAEECEDCTPE